MRVFLTGATGYLGAHIVDALLAGGHAVTALVRDPGRATSLGERGVDLCRGDLLDPPTWRDAVAAAEGIVHAAALVSAWGPSPADFDRVNVEAPLAILDAARAARTARVVVVSSLFALRPSPDGEPLDERALDGPLQPVHRASDYARTKAIAARRICERQDAGEGTILVFPTVLLGPGPRTDGNHTAHVLDEVRRGRLPGLIGSGAQRWNLVGVADAARGAVLALERGAPGGRYLLGGENWTQAELVARGAELLGVPAPARRLGTRLPMAIAAACEGWARLSGRPPMLTRGEVALYDRHWAYRSDRAATELGFAPRPIVEVLSETITWLKSRN